MTCSTIGGGPKRPQHRALRPRTAPTSRIKCGAGTSPGCRGQPACRRQVCGPFTFLCRIIDLYSRRIVGWEAHEAESRAQARNLVERTVWREGILNPPRVLHGDQVRPLRGATVQALLGRLGIAASFSRPRVSEDNAYAEALFRALKYSPGFPRQGFATLAAARDWVQAFADGYNTVHRHRGIQYVTPRQRHSGEDVAILRGRHELYEAARRQHPARWSGDAQLGSHSRSLAEPGN